MDTLRSLRVFASIANTKSFTLTSEQLGISTAMATKHIKNIEAYAGARLLNRTSRNVSLTEAGELYLLRVKELLEGLQEASELVSESTVVPKGTLKISIPVWMTTNKFTEYLAYYHRSNPEVQLNINLTSAFVNLVEEGFDLVIRVGQTVTDGLIARKLGYLHFICVSSPDCAKKHNYPQNLSDLDGCLFLAYTRMISGSIIRVPNKENSLSINVKPVLTSENDTLILNAALQGMGITILPKWLVEEHIESGRLVQLLPNIVDVLVPLYALYPDRNFLPAKTRSFIDLMLKAELFADSE